MPVTNITVTDKIYCEDRAGKSLPQVIDLCCSFQVKDHDRHFASSNNIELKLFNNVELTYLKTRARRRAINGCSRSSIACFKAGGTTSTSHPRNARATPAAKEEDFVAEVTASQASSTSTISTTTPGASTSLRQRRTSQRCPVLQVAHLDRQAAGAAGGKSMAGATA